MTATQLLAAVQALPVGEVAMHCIYSTCGGNGSSGFHDNQYMRWLTDNNKTYDTWEESVTGYMLALKKGYLPLR